MKELRRARLLATTIIAGSACALSLPAYAQDTSTADDPVVQGDAAAVPVEQVIEDDSGAIVVTGSRLRRDERTSADPVTIIDPDTSLREGRLDTAEVLRSAPIASGSTQVTSTLSTNFVVNGGEGVQTISLRGLGANRTLVLLNGRRAGPAGVRGGVSAFDLNVIPIEAIRSIDILKTGASSIYGSDAIAGVVNLITKKDVRGIEMRGFVSVPESSGAEQYSVSGLAGFGLGERGHILVGADYYRINELERQDRSYLGCEEEYVFNQAGGRADPIDPRTGQPYCGAFLNNVIGLTDFAPALGSGSNLRRRPFPGGALRAITAIQFNTPGSRLNEFLLPLDPAANPDQFTAPSTFFPVGAYSATGLALQNNYDLRVNGDSIIPKTDRYTLFAEGEYKITDNLTVFFEGLFNKRTTKTDSSRQLFFDQFTGDSILPFFFCSDPNCDPNAPGDPFNTEFSGAQILQPVIYAPFDSSTDVKYYRGVAGVRADLENVLPKGFLDFYFQHSRSDGDYDRQIIFRDAIQFGVAELRTNSCAGTVTAIRGVPCVDIDYTDPRVLRGDFTAAERAFLFGVDRGNTLYKQNTAELSFGGDLFSLPAGPVKIALGGQWRRDEIRDRPGEASLTNNLFGSTRSGVTAGFQRTLEGFGEIEVPVIRSETLFFKDITLNAAARLTSTYSRRRDGLDDSDKGNWTYKLGANWALTDFLRLRATYGTSFRSPALFEQFLADESGFLDQNVDPCSNLDIRLQQGTVSQRVNDNCRSQGIPGNYDGVGPSAESFSGGGIGVLDPETSKALTLGVVLTPDSWVWGGGRFSLAVDYIDINVRDQVTQLGAANILQGCYASDDFPADPLCALFTRSPAGGIGAFNILTVRDPFLNIDQQRNKSIDITTRFDQDLGRLGRLQLFGQATIQLRDRFTLFQGFPSNFNGEVGDPKFTADLNASWTKDNVRITYGLEYIGKTNDREDLEDLGLPLTPEGCIASAGALALRGGPYCPIFKLPSVVYHSISAEVDVDDRFSFLFGVSNLFDKKPPLVSTVGTPITAFAQVSQLGTYYDLLGRRFFMTVRAKLGGAF